MDENWYKIFNGGEQIVTSEDEMRALGRRIGKILSGGEVVGLVGDLGAGKTRLCAGIIDGLGCNETVVSPTFALVNEHRGGRLPVSHLDLYRLKGPEELTGIGWEEILDSGDVVLVEWADICAEAMPADTIWLRVEHVDATTRRVTLYTD